MCTRIFSFGFFLFLFVFGMTQGATIYVPDDFPTIQTAIDAAVDNDLVIVKPGTYLENIDFVGKKITVKSEAGPEVTTIDGGNPVSPDYGSVVRFNSGETHDTRLEGFTITNGYGTYKSYSTHGGPGHWGGGIFCDLASPTITGNIITNNTASQWGAGIWVYESATIISDNDIYSNAATHYGGGVSTMCTNPSIYPTMINNTLYDNTASYGGGIFNGDFADVIGNVIYLNSSSSGGGGINTGASTIKNNLITGNSAAIGGGIRCGSPTSSAIIENNTITGNTASYKGGGIYVEGSVDIRYVVVRNTILWKNTPDEIYIKANSILDISYSDIDGGQSSVDIEPGATLNWGFGMIDTNPLFESVPEGDYYLKQDPPQTGEPTSHCVDAGDPQTAMFDGTTRTDHVQDTGIVDMGYHYPVEDLFQGLVLWNKLGSDNEVLNSAFGPNLEFYTGGGGFEVPGDRVYVPGKEGDSVTLKGQYSALDRVHNLVLNNVSNYIDPEKGCVEVWYYQSGVPVAYSHGEYRLFDGSFGLGSGMFLDVAASTNSMRFMLEFGGAHRKIEYDPSNIPNYHWVHVAASWDRNGIEGSQDTMRLYVGGNIVASANWTDWGTAVGSAADICGGNDQNIAGKFRVDELKIWDYAKTDFGLDLFTLAVTPNPIIAGANATFSVVNGDPMTPTYLVYSLIGLGSKYVPPLEVTIGLKNPVLIDMEMTDSTGMADWIKHIPSYAGGYPVWFQAAQYGQVTNVVATSIL